MTITGIITKIHDTVIVSDKFKKRLVWIETTERWSQLIEFQFVQDNTDILDNYKEQQEVEISFDVRGNKWTAKDGTEKVFNTLQAWRISNVDNQPATPTPATNEKDDLPF